MLSNFKNSQMMLPARKLVRSIKYSLDIIPLPEQRVQARLAKENVSSRSLFVVGHARSGTSILTEALNLQREIFVSNEAYYFLNPHDAEFIQNFNHRHAVLFERPLTKSTFMPVFFKGKNYWYSFITEIAKYHQWVGDKFAFHYLHNLHDAKDPLQNFIEFHSQYFYDSTYVQIFRDPIATIISTQKLLRAPNILIHAKTWLLVVKNWIKMLRVFPNVHTVLHEDLNSETFALLLAKLNVVPASSEAVFNHKAITQHHSQYVNDAEKFRMIEKLGEVYEGIKACTSKELLPLDASFKLAKSPLTGLNELCNQLLAEVEGKLSSQ